MIRVFVGEDRLAAETALKRLIGGNYEVFEGETLTVGDLPSIFQGTSLFEAGKRRILLKNLSENAAVWEKIAEYAETEHEVVVWELKADKRSVGYRNLKAAGVEIQEFALKAKPEAKMVFGVLDTALRDGKRAVAQVEQIELEQDPYMFFGLLVTQALKKFEQRGGMKEKRLLKELAKLDMEMKTTGLEPWMLIKTFLLRAKSI